jgi:hypothetical protein
MSSQGAPGGPGLDDDHADVVGHDVVQLTGDVAAFLGDRPFPLDGSIAFRPVRAFLDGTDIGAPLPRPRTEQPGDETGHLDLDEGAERGRDAALDGHQGPERRAERDRPGGGGASIQQVGDGVQRDEAAQTRVEGIRREEGMDGRGRAGHEEDGEWGDVAEDQRDRLEQEQGDAERRERADVSRAAEYGHQRQEGQPHCEQAVEDDLVRAEPERPEGHAR